MAMIIIYILYIVIEKKNLFSYIHACTIIVRYTKKGKYINKLESFLRIEILAKNLSIPINRPIRNINAYTVQLRRVTNVLNFFCIMPVFLEDMPANKAEIVFPTIF